GDCFAVERYVMTSNEEKSRLLQSLELLTVCVLVLKSGFTVTGESACVSHENFDGPLGRKIARQKAVEKIWALEGYRLKQELLEYPYGRPKMLGRDEEGCEQCGWT